MTWKEVAEIQEAKRVHQTTFRRVLAALTSFRVCVQCVRLHLTYLNSWIVAVSYAKKGLTNDARLVSFMRKRKAYI